MTKSVECWWGPSSPVLVVLCTFALGFQLGLKKLGILLTPLCGAISGLSEEGRSRVGIG